MVALVRRLKRIFVCGIVVKTGKIIVIKRNSELWFIKIAKADGYQVAPLFSKVKIEIGSIQELFLTN
jgi:hypothetical protein